MADRKLSASSDLAGEPASADLLLVVDVSDTTDGAGGTTKKNLWSAISALWIRHSIATAANDFIIASGSGAFVKKTLAETKTILGFPTGTLVGTSDTQTLTAKTLTTPIISTISNTGTVTLPTATDTLVARATTDTLTNKRITKRLVTVTQHATPTTNTDNGDVFQITGLAQAITSMTTNLSGSPAAGDMIMFQITDNGTARAIAWGASFASTTITLPTTTVISTMLRVLFQRNNANNAWDCIGTA